MITFSFLVQDYIPFQRKQLFIITQHHISEIYLII